MKDIADDLALIVRNAIAYIKNLEQQINELKRKPVQEPVAWMHNLIDDNIITHRPADIDRHPDRWTALYREPKPCPTCEALARTVMMDQTGHDPAPPQRKPLTEADIDAGPHAGITTPADYFDFAPPQQALTIERLRDALVASRIIPPAAVEDPDEYDDGVTLFRIEALHRRIT